MNGLAEQVDRDQRQLSVVLAVDPLPRGPYRI